MRYNKYSTPTVFPCLTPPFWDPSPQDGLFGILQRASTSTSRHSVHHCFLLSEPLEEFLKASPHFVPSVPLMQLEAQIHIFIFAHINLVGYEQMGRSIPVCVSMVSPPGLWEPWSLMYQAHTPFSALVSSLVQVQVWWAGQEEGNSGPSLVISFQVFCNLLSVGLCWPLPGSHLKKIFYGNYGPANIRKTGTLIQHGLGHSDVPLKLQFFLTK